MKKEDRTCKEEDYICREEDHMYEFGVCITCGQSAPIETKSKRGRVAPE